MGILDFKPFYSVYNFFNYKKLKQNIPLFKKYNIKKYYFSSLSSTDFSHISNPEIPWLDKGDASVLLPSLPQFGSLPGEYQEALKTWSKDGLAILRGAYTKQEVDALNSEIERMLEKGEIEWKYKNKLMFAVKKSGLVEQIVSKKILKEVLEMLLGKSVVLFQSINFYRGSQQAAHSDIVHMTTFPQGYLIAAWIALEDIDEDQGPLFYYPGSHKLPYFLNSDYDHGGSKYFLGKDSYKKYEQAIGEYIRNNKLEKKTFKAKKGDVLIWHANLLHGGSEILNPSSTRKSMVLHYYAEGVICYHEISQRPAL